MIQNENANGNKKLVTLQNQAKTKFINIPCIENMLCILTHTFVNQQIRIHSNVRKSIGGPAVTAVGHFSK